MLLLNVGEGETEVNEDENWGEQHRALVRHRENRCGLIATSMPGGRGGRLNVEVSAGCPWRTADDWGACGNTGILIDLASKREEGFRRDCRCGCGCLVCGRYLVVGEEKRGEERRRAMKD